MVTLRYIQGYIYYIIPPRGGERLKKHVWGEKMKKGKKEKGEKRGKKEKKGEKRGGKREKRGKMGENMKNKVKKARRTPQNWGKKIFLRIVDAKKMILM